MKGEVYIFKNYESERVGRGNPKSFFIGIILLCIGVFLVFKNTTTFSSFSLGWMFGGNIDPPAGLTILPFLIGIVILLATNKPVIGWMFIVIGILIIVLGILMSLRFRWRALTLFDTILIFGLTAAGLGLVIKGIFGKK